MRWASATVSASSPIGRVSALNSPSFLQRGVVHLHARHRRPFVVAIGEVFLRLVRGEILEELDRGLLVRRVLEHAGADTLMWVPQLAWFGHTALIFATTA